ncbi:MAG: hypothetical protein JXA18_09435 [Chitinispirillaceae bacterium]|nr:hypothetical protein [Chitinispirillaceae bacterium]
MKAYHAMMFFFLAGASFAAIKVPHARIDSLIFERTFPADARKQLRETVNKRVGTMQMMYGDLLDRCDRCRGAVKMEFTTDSTGSVSSARIVHVGTRIIDRMFLDAIEDLQWVETDASGPDFTARATISFRSTKQQSANGSGRAVMSAVGIIISLLSLIISFSRLGGI